MKFPQGFRWKFVRTLGGGGQGQVVAVADNDAGGDQEYALKKLAGDKPRKAYQRIAREVEATKKLNHPSIIKIIDHSEPDDDFHYYVMEQPPEARSLKKLLSTGETPYCGDPLKSLKLFMQIVEVIGACEEAGIVHRDLQPANILILPDESIKIIDFGICQLADAAAVDLTSTDEGVGTQNYMSPECESGAEGEATSRSDLYSAGKILWSAMTGKFAFARESGAFTRQSMKSLCPDQPEAWHLHHIFAKTIRHAPSERWQTADEALKGARHVRFLMVSGYPPLEMLDERCPLCGVGSLGAFRVSHMVFGNPNPAGIVSLQCDYCGFCLARNNELVKENMARAAQFQ